MAAGAILTSSVTSHAYGAYGTIINPIKYPLYVVGVGGVFTTDPGVDMAYYRMALAVADIIGNEQIISELKMYSYDYVSTVGFRIFQPIMLPIPILLSAGYFLRAALASSLGTATLQISVIVIPAAELITLVQ
jgi:hypothetical protein